MSLNIENEVQWLTELILPEILKTGRLIDNYDDSQAQTFQVDSIEIEYIGPDEAYMLTLCYRATVNLSYKSEKLQRKLIVKVNILYIVYLRILMWYKYYIKSINESC